MNRDVGSFAITIAELAIIISCASIILNAITLWKVWPTAVEVVSVRKPIIILDIHPHADAIAIGEPFPVTFEFEKTREDCENGHVVRDMWNVENGDNYTIDERPTVQAPKGFGKFRAELATRPFDPAKADLMKPGLWRIDSVVSYECPTPGGDGLSVRQTPFSTPIFRVFDPDKEKGDR